MVSACLHNSESGLCGSRGKARAARWRSSGNSPRRDVRVANVSSAETKVCCSSISTGSHQAAVVEIQPSCKGKKKQRKKEERMARFIHGGRERASALELERGLRDPPPQANSNDRVTPMQLQLLHSKSTMSTVVCLGWRDTLPAAGVTLLGGCALQIGW